jgi:hypothetical protein
LPPADDRGGKWRSKWLSEVEEEWRRGWQPHCCHKRLFENRIFL